MIGRRSTAAGGSAAGSRRCAADKAAAKAKKAERKAAKAESKAATAAAATVASRAERKAAKAEGKVAKAEGKAVAAEKKAAKATAKAAKTRGLINRVTDPKSAKRAVAIGKILAPALAPVVIKAAAGARGALDASRARKLGVPVTEVAAYRGPTGTVGARITGLTDAVRELATRPGKDLQITRFTEVASSRLTDLTAVVQAAASMPRSRRSEVLRAVDRELDGIDADLITHLMTPRQR